jgi:hypothetical protein
LPDPIGALGAMDVLLAVSNRQLAGVSPSARLVDLGIRNARAVADVRAVSWGPGERKADG